MDPVLIHARNPGPYTGAGNNLWLLPGRAPTLVDAGPRGAAPHLADVEAALGGARLVQVLVTHGHADHAGAAEAIARRWPAVALRKIPWPGRDAGIAWSYLEDGETLAAGDGWLTVVHTPGHAPDHAAFHDARRGAIFTGDLLVRGGTVLIPASDGGTLADYLRSLERIIRLAPARALPGHGPVIDDPAALAREYLEHRRDRERQIREALDAGAATIDAIVARVYEGLAPALRHAAAQSVLAHLIKLEAEGRVVRQRDRWAVVVR
jgi:glyoxylase-like metal-dependent hydrolase (beta-lactamase superfamily II)